MSPGGVGFWRTRTPGCSQLVNPLYQVTQKKNYFDGGPEEQRALEEIKEEAGGAVALGSGQDRS